MMIGIVSSKPKVSALIPGRALAEQVFSGAAGAPLSTGNGIRLLINAEENDPVWSAAVESASATIHFEMSIMHDDAIGLRFSEILMKKARQRSEKAGLTTIRHSAPEGFPAAWRGKGCREDEPPPPTKEVGRGLQ